MATHSSILAWEEPGGLHDPMGSQRVGHDWATNTTTTINFIITAYCCVLSHFSCVWLCNSMDCSPPGSSIPDSLPARILEWVAMASSRGSSSPRDQTHVSYVSCIGRWVLDHWLPGKTIITLTTLTQIAQIESKQINYFVLKFSFSLFLLSKTQRKQAQKDSMCQILELIYLSQLLTVG